MTLVWCLVSWTLVAQWPPFPAPAPPGPPVNSAACVVRRDLSSSGPRFARFSIDPADEPGVYRPTSLPAGLFDVTIAPNHAEEGLPSEGFARFDADADQRPWRPGKNVGSFSAPTPVRSCK